MDDGVGFPASTGPFYGTNFMNLMGTAPFSPSTHITSGVFYDETPSTSPFADPWWYRREFSLPLKKVGESVELTLDGITYGAEVWVNGNQIATPDQTQGSYRAFRWEIGKWLNPSPSKNVIAVKVWTPHPHDLMASWVDWNFTPQDKNMGLWRGASIRTHGGVTVSHPVVLSTVKMPEGDHADLTVEAELSNTQDQEIQGIVLGEIEGTTFSKTITLQAHETKVVSFSPEEFPQQLKITNPKLWWPAQMGAPNLYHLKLVFQKDGEVSDQKEIDFGIRDVRTGLNAQEAREFFINGKPLLIRGGGWASDIFLRFHPERIEKEMNYVLDMGLNTIRLEGQMQPDAFFSLADKKGILIMPGLVCCNTWQMDVADWSPEKRAVAVESVKDLGLALRSHPSVFVFLYGSDSAPIESLENLYLSAFKDIHWPNPLVSSAAEDNTPSNGITGFKMQGPYDYTAPSYWYTDKTGGGAFGFNTETSPGPSIPTLEGLKKFLPPENLNHIDSAWPLHAGQNGFNSIDLHTKALEKIYGPIENMNDMVEKSQVMDYSDHRAMFEAFNRNKKQGASGIVQWMLNNAYPSLIWHLYDYYLEPDAAYFGVKEANRPLHLIYGYDNQEISLVNSSYSASAGLQANVQTLDLDSNLISSQTKVVDIQSNDCVPVFQVKRPDSTRGGIYFVKLELSDAKGELLDSNFYWLPEKLEDHPLKQGEPEADFTALRSMPMAQIEINHSWDAMSQTETLHILNPGKTTAFFLQLKLTEGSEQKSILPVLWDDNDFTLLPGEQRTIRARFPNEKVTHEPDLHGQGWNVSAW